MPETIPWPSPCGTCGGARRFTRVPAPTQGGARYLTHCREYPKHDLRDEDLRLVGECRRYSPADRWAGHDSKLRAGTGEVIGSVAEPVIG